MGRLRSLLPALAISCVCAGWACGEDFDPEGRFGWYVAGSGGWTSSGDLKVDGSDAADGPFVPDVEVSLDPGYAAQVGVGMMFDGARGELELGYRSNAVSGISADGADAAFDDTDFSVLTIAVNGLYDFPIAGPLGGYIGGGAGIGIIESTTSVQTTPGGTVYDLDADTSGLVLQFMTGVQCRLSQKWYLTAGYRLWVLMDAGVSVNDTTGGGSTVIVDEDESQIDPMLMHTLELGLRYEF